VHIPADRSRLLVVSIPRDTIVDIPSCKTPTGMTAPVRDRFNAAFSLAGPGCTIKTVEQNTGVYIDHFVVVDFSGFQNMVDALGKVRVCLPEAVNDPKSGLNLPAGYSEVNGAQALAYVRTRYSIGNGSDISRISRQQAFASSVISKVTSAGTLLNPAKLLAFLRAATKSITTDPQLGSLNQMRQLAQQLRNIPPSKITFVTTPWLVNPDDPNTVIWNPAKIGALWKALKNDTPYPPPSPKPAVIDGKAISAAPDTISVRVLNGTGRSGRATRASRQFTAQGYSVVVVDNAESSDYLSTVIRYDPAYAANAARTLAAAIPGASREKAPGLGSTVDVVVGKNFGGVRAVTVKAPPDPNENIRTATQNICS
jgi:LCP family protein required for cell wall assembly